MVQVALAEFQQLDVAFLNAGSFGQKKITGIEEVDIDSLFNSYFKSVVWGLKHVLPVMKDFPGKGGSVIVNTSCMGSVARIAFAGSSMYFAAKAAADMLVEYTIVSAVAPGIASTNGWAKGIQLVGRAGKSDEVANVVTMLASDDGTFFTGSIIKVDGGWSLQAWAIFVALLYLDCT